MVSLVIEVKQDGGSTSTLALGPTHLWTRHIPCAMLCEISVDEENLIDEPVRRNPWTELESGVGTWQFCNSAGILL